MTPGLSMHRVPAASENPDGSRRLNALSFEWPGRLNHGAEFSTPRPRGFSAPMVFSYLTMNVANLLKRRPPRAAHDQVHQAPHWYQVKHTGVHGGTSPPSSSAADLPPEEWVVRGGTTPRLLPDDDERSWGDLQGGDSRHPSARVTPPDRLWDPTIPQTDRAVCSLFRESVTVGSRTGTGVWCSLSKGLVRPRAHPDAFWVGCPSGLAGLLGAASIPLPNRRPHPVDRL